jgi:hypothetical protein
VKCYLLPLHVVSQATVSSYRFLINATENRDYYVRVFAKNADLTWGPPRTCDPKVTTPRLAFVTKVFGGQSIPLVGGLVVLAIKNTGTGQFAHAVPVSARMVNGTGGRSYQVTNV